jgi:osmotically-inducible protein OsmY
MVVVSQGVRGRDVLESLTVTSSVPTSSDLACQDRIQNLLQGERPEFRHLQVTTHRGTVTMQGRVSSYYLRQLAIRCCQQAAGAFHINDQLQVGTA